MDINNFGISPSQISESVANILGKAYEEAESRKCVLTSSHILFALTLLERDKFLAVIEYIGVNPGEILKEVELLFSRINLRPVGRVSVSPPIKVIMKTAVVVARMSNRTVVEWYDLLHALADDKEGIIAFLMQQRGIDANMFHSRLSKYILDAEFKEQELIKKFELPPFMKSFGTNLNFLAHQNKLPPVFGRDREIKKVLEILCHIERPNSVMLVGEPGVGKTAIAEGLARMIEFEPDKIPNRLRDSQIINLQMNNLVAGTMLRGMFEDRIQNIIKEAKEMPNLILFIDEAHTIIGAGSAMGAPSDAANILKSVLARGEVRIIASTTLSEYKEYIQEDEALSRRFRPVQINEPTLEEARNILYKVRPRLEHNYSIVLSDEAIETALEMSPRYMRNLHLPDKVIGWLDTAAVRAEMNGQSEVTRKDVISVIADVAQIPEDMVFRDVTSRFKDIEERLKERVIGQAKAISAVSRRLILNKGPLKDGFDRPDGVLLFLGPTGVGKTELAKAVAEFLFGDEKKMIRIDMSEYQDDARSGDKLIGAPRGILGSERGGILTNQLKDNPYSVVLLDEVEKASPSLLNLFLQAFDEGWLTDGRGKRVYLSDAIIIMTSNVGSQAFRRLTSPLGFLSGQANIGQIEREAIRHMENMFSPEFRNRIDETIIFNPLSEEEVGMITRNHLGILRRNLAESGKDFNITIEALNCLIKKGHSLAFGARFLKRTIDELIKIPISQNLSDSSVFNVKLVEGEILVDVIGDVFAEWVFDNKEKIEFT